MSKQDPKTDKAVQGVAKILAAGYVRLLQKEAAGEAGTKERTEPSPAEGAERDGARRRGPKPAKQSSETEGLPTPTAIQRTPRPDVSDAVRQETADRLRGLQKMTVAELRVEYERVLGQPAKSTHRQHLFRRIAWEIQAQAEGHLPQAVREHAFRIAEQTPLFKRIDEALKKRRLPKAPQESGIARQRLRTPTPSKPRPRDARLPAPGSMLIVKQGKVALRVTVLQNGFEYAGKQYRSLTAVARQITGRQVNPYEFFGLGPPPDPKRDL